MDYFKLISGIALLIILSWLLMKNTKHKGFMNALLQIDTFLGLIAAIYLIVTSTASLLSQLY
jgi:hypothetical protein